MCGCEKKSQAVPKDPDSSGLQTENFKDNNEKCSKTLGWLATKSKAVGSMEHTVQKQRQGWTKHAYWQNYL